MSDNSSVKYVQFVEINVVHNVNLQMANRRHNSSSHNYSQAACHGLVQFCWCDGTFKSFKFSKTGTLGVISEVGHEKCRGTARKSIFVWNIPFLCAFFRFGVPLTVFPPPQIISFNVLFWILGFLLLGVGVWSRLEKDNLYSQLALFYLDPAWLLVIIGGVIFCIGFSGLLICHVFSNLIF